MNKTIVLHDLDMDCVEKSLANAQASGGYTVISPSKEIKPCTGCYSCWIKTPGKCIIDDADSRLAVTLPYHEELIVISRLVFGGLSPDIKAVFDRSIGYISPFFRIVNGEMHHKKRYDKAPELRYMFYGEKLTEQEKSTARKLVEANAVNFGAEKHTVCFYTSPEEILGVLA